MRKTRCSTCSTRSTRRRASDAHRGPDLHLRGGRRRAQAHGGAVMTGLFASLFMFLFGAAAVFVVFFTTDVVKFFKRRRELRSRRAEHFKTASSRGCELCNRERDVNEMPKAGGKFVGFIPGHDDEPTNVGGRTKDEGGVSPLLAGWIGYEIGRNSGAPSAEAPEGATDPRDYAADPPAPAPDSDP